MEAKRVGDFAGAAQQLRSVRSSIVRYAGNDEVLQGLAADLERDVGEFTQVMSPLARQGHFFAAEVIGKFRDASGRAQQNPPSKP